MHYLNSISFTLQLTPCLFYQSIFQHLQALHTAWMLVLQSIGTPVGTLWRGAMIDHIGTVIKMQTQTQEPPPAQVQPMHKHQ